ncbi:MAG: sugar phosphate isomerase/epimerase [Chloroflexota bacterium]
MTQPLPISVQLYSVRDALAADWEGTLEQIASMGYVGVETAGFAYAPSQANAINKIQSLGLTISGAHSPHPTGDNKNQVLETMAATGSTRLISAFMPPENYQSIDEIKKLVGEFNQSNANAKAAGLSFGIHNHWWEYEMVDGKRAIQHLIDEGLDDDIFFEIDTYWVATAGAGVVQEITKYADRIPLLHIKDGPTGSDSNMVAVGQGVMDFHSIIPAAPNAEWLVVELDRCDTDMLTAVRESIDYLAAEGLGRKK